MAIPGPRVGAAALVTGASSGIGAAIARQLAAREHDLVLVARRQDRLETLAAAFPERRIEILPCDIADDRAREELLRRIDDTGLEIDIAVLSAGFGMGGPYLEHDRDRVAEMIRTNVEATFVLSHALLEPMTERRRGALLIVSSVAGFQPMPLFGPYAATKAAVTSFAEMLSHEMKSFGVTVSALAPGSVQTEFAHVAGRETTEQDLPRFLVIDADTCARIALDGLDAGQRVITPRAGVKALAFAGRHLPRAIWLPLCERLTGD